MAYASVLRSELRFALWGWGASYRLHVGYATPSSAARTASQSAYASTLDLGSTLLPLGVRQLRTVQSQLLAVVTTEIGAPNGVQHLLLVPDAVGHGVDDEEPVPSAGQAIQLEWITGARGRGVNGRTYFPYLGRSSYVNPSLDNINVAASDAIETLCSAWAFGVAGALGGEMVVCRRVLNGAPISVLDSHKVTGVAVRRTEFAHQRRRVEWRRPYFPSP